MTAVYRYILSTAVKYDVGSSLKVCVWPASVLAKGADIIVNLDHSVGAGRPPAESHLYACAV